MENTPWNNYVEQTKAKPPRPLLIEALQYVTHKSEALDVGSGALNDSKFLLQEGFAHVTAVDQTSIAQEIAVLLPKDRFEYKISKIEDMNLLSESYDFINAQLSLPFINPEVFKETFQKLISSLKKGGVINGQFFGNRDGWNYNEDMTFLTIEEARELLSELNLISFEEKEAPGVTAAGNIKQWHIFDFIAKK